MALKVAQLDIGPVRQPEHVLVGVVAGGCTVPQPEYGQQLVLQLRQRALCPAGDEGPRLRAPLLGTAENLKDDGIGLAAAPPAVQQQVPFEGQRQDARLKRRGRNVDGGGVVHHEAILAGSACPIFLHSLL